MTVNPFWFGFLIGTIVTVVLIIFIGSLSHKNKGAEWAEYEPTEEEYKKILEDMTWQHFTVERKNGYLVGKPIEDEDDEEGT